jgi:hypothetical protein
VGEFREDTIPAGEVAQIRSERAIVECVAKDRVIDVEDGRGHAVAPRLQDAIGQRHVNVHCGHLELHLRAGSASTDKSWGSPPAATLGYHPTFQSVRKRYRPMSQRDAARVRGKLSARKTERE